MTELLKSPLKSGVDKGGGSNKLLFCFFTRIVNSKCYIRTKFVGYSMQYSLFCVVWLYTKNENISAISFHIEGN